MPLFLVCQPVRGAGGEFNFMDACAVLHVGLLPENRLDTLCRRANNTLMWPVEMINLKKGRSFFKMCIAGYQPVAPCLGIKGLLSRCVVAC